MRHTILFIDDDALLINTLKKRFSGFGIDAYSVPGPSGAKEILSKIVPEVIVLDLLLTEEDGSQGILDYIKSQDKLKNIPILILTNMDKPELKQLMLQQGIKEYLVKGSMSLDEIYEKVVSYLEPAK